MNLITVFVLEWANHLEVIYSIARIFNSLRFVIYSIFGKLDKKVFFFLYGKDGFTRTYPILNITKSILVYMCHVHFNDYFVS